MKSIYLQYYKDITLKYFIEASSHPEGRHRLGSRPIIIRMPHLAQPITISKYV